MQQREVLRLWFDASRMIYNRAVAHANASGETSLKALRDAAGIADERWRVEAPVRMVDVPYEIRDSPLQDLQKAAAAGRAKAKRNHRAFKFRRRKCDTESLTLRKRQLNCKTGRGSVWPSLFGSIFDRSAMLTEKGKTLPHIFECDTRVLHDARLGHFYLCIPIVLNDRLPETQGEKVQRVVSIDPGVRTFATCYNPDGSVTEWGTNNERLSNLKRLADAIETRGRSRHGRARKRTLRAAARCRARMRDMASEMHRKLARWLCTEHDVILLPEFHVQRISRRFVGRKISRSTVERIHGLCHYKFRQFVAHKAVELGARLILCDERYTSQTCGRCGLLNKNLGSSKDFECPECRYAADRDANAARNVLLRYIALNNIEC